jgi:hypothetical protein
MGLSDKKLVESFYTQISENWKRLRTFYILKLNSTGIAVQGSTKWDMMKC